jgi:hypothetical protein
MMILFLAADSGSSGIDRIEAAIIELMISIYTHELSFNSGGS